MVNFLKVLPLFAGLLVSGCATVGAPPRRQVIQVQVEAGDTLNTIAKQFDSDWRDIALLNKPSLVDGLRVGQVLNVVPGPNGQQEIAAQDHNGTEESVEDEDDLAFMPRRKGLFNAPKDTPADFIFPVEGRITSYFGKRGRKNHKGIDISANVGTPILAAGDGEVVFSGRRRGYGSTVVVDHGGFLTLYAHCSKMIASVGDSVRQGDYIAKSGRSGNARGAHLHFEIRDAKNVPLDPVPFLHHKSMVLRANKKNKTANAVVAEVDAANAAPTHARAKTAKRGGLYVKGH